MAKPENDEIYPEKQTWSTWEELLLACAVHRHGIDSWDSVAAEIQKQNSSFRTLTALDCRHKYDDLKRRFSRELGSNEGETVDEISSVPWLEQLRKLRVDELRREVERYDLSISSLQLKVKRLEDEREKSLKEVDTVTGKSDLDKIAETKESHRESGNNAAVAADEPSKSPDLKENRSENTKRDANFAESNPNGKPGREDSCKGSCESVAKESDRAETGREGNDSPEFVESMDESKGGGEEEAKETSDVQSSASLPRKEMTEPDKSLTVNPISIESQPLINFIEILQSHPIGSHFSRRLESQETSCDYDKIIRQHIDFETIRSRVEEGNYKSSRSKFHRDLLLLINNARVFYGERSSEFNAVSQLNQLIKKQMSLFRKPPTVVSKEEEVTVSSLKPTMSVSVPIVACRKRSSLAVRSSGSVVEPFKKKIAVKDEKPVLDESDDKDEEPIVSKKTSKGRTTQPSLAKKVNAGGSDPKKPNVEKKGSNTIGGSKRQSAASFLKRMKAVSSSDPVVIETVKADSSNGKRGAEQKRCNNSKNEKVDAVGQKRAVGKKPIVEKGSPAKKNSVSATTRRGGAASSSPIASKRGSEASEKETGSSSRPKKRTRRF